MPFVLSALLVLVLIWSGTAHAAADRLVSAKGSDQNGGNPCLNSLVPCRTLAHALAQADSGDTIKVAKGTYKENVSITASGTRTIKGGYDAKTFGEGTRDIVRNKTTFTGVTVGVFLAIEADAAGVIIQLTLDGVFIAGSVGKTPLFGGGVSALAQDGGAIALTLDRVTMTGNRAFSGGGLDVVGDDGTITLNITRSLFHGNRAIGAGGAISAASFRTGTVALTVEDTTFSSNSADFSGGAIDATSNTAVGGSTAMTLRRAIFDKNSAKGGGDGGAISMLAHDSSGGAGSVALTLENSVLQGNTAGYGGAVFLISIVSDTPAGTATIAADLMNNTIVDNKSTSFGGALLISTSNQTGTGAGSSTVTATLQNNIVYSNVAKGFSPGNDIDILPPDSGEHASLTLKTNDIGFLFAGAGTTIVADPGPQLNVDPQLVKKQGIYRLRATSPMINAGTCDGAPASDFEGDSRPTGTGPCVVDIGADEFIP